MTAPTADDATAVARDVLGEPIATVRRFTTGAGNWVYDVASVRGTRVVVRFMRSRAEAAAGVYWSNRLRPLGVPLPSLLAHHDGDMPWMVLGRFEGVDLEHTCRGLTESQKLGILEQVMRAQAIVQTLPPGRGFGWVTMPDEAPHARWQDVLASSLALSHERIVNVGVVDPSVVERVGRLLPRFNEYFTSIRPIAFLDDTTTRNVIVHNGIFQGIVDVDSICYGDPLLVTSLTRMAMLNLGCGTLYTDAWLDRLNASPQQRHVVGLYTAIFCVNFLSEQGQQFNLDAPPPVDPHGVQRLEAILDRILAATEAGWQPST